MSSSPPVIKLSESLSINRANLEELLKRRFFFAPSFSIYGGVAGLYDYGPPGCAVKSNFLSQWRRHFVLEENMLEIDSPCLTPYAVLKTSGHVDRFQDLMVKDTVNGNCYRADHLLKEHIDKLSDLKETTEERKKELSVIKAKIDDYTCDQLAKILTDLEIKAPDTGNAITPPFPFNLMFQTSIGPTGQHVGFLRPETAQGIFVNFARLLELNGGKLPFAAATIGGAFRNEIAPRSGLLRVREFTLAEIEHFVHPSDKSHPKFEQSASQVLNLYPRKNQATTQEVIQLSVSEAVATGIINNQTLGYFMARVATFLMGSGIRKDGLRFRQHMENEMAHYACDCWDAELLTSYGWVECVGIADRSAYDLTVHSKATKARLSFHEAFPEPKLINVLVALPNKGLIGKTFKTSAKEIISHIEQLEEPFVKDLKCSLETDKKATLTIDNKAYELTPEMVNFQHKETKITGQAIIPSVIEPSFGVGRIIYSIFEQNYHVREGDAKRGYLSLPASIAPLKCSVLPLTGHADLAALIKTIVNNLISEGLPFKVDDSGTSIGRRYARTDEVGVPFGITIDFDSVKDNTVTLRERDSTLQVRIPIDVVAGVIRALCEEKTTWSEVQSKYPKFESKDE